MKTKSFALLLLVALVMPGQGYAYPKVQEVTTPSGITAWLMQVDSLPLMTMRIAFKGAGSAYDSEVQQGLAALTSEMLLEGTRTHPSADFHAELESYAIDMDFSVDDDYLVAELQTLTEHQEKAFSLLSDALSQPLLAEASIDKVGQKFAANRRRQQQFPNYVAQRTLYEHIFPGHGYSFPVLGTDDTVGALGQGDLRRYIMEKLARDRMVISVSGDIDAEMLTALLEKHLAPLPAKGAPYVPLPKAEPKAEGVVRKVMDATQSSIVFSGPSVDRDDPDFYPAFVLNHIVGSGGFASLIMKKLREEDGLIYSAGSSMGGFPQAPTLVGLMSTRTEHADQTLTTLQALLKDVAEGTISQKVLDNALTDITGALPLRLDTTGKMTAYLLSMQLYGLGTDYLEQRNAYFEAVTLADINRLAAVMFDEKSMTFVVTGPEATSSDKHDGAPSGKADEEEG